MKEEWLFPGAIVSVDVETTSALVAEIKRLIDVVGGMALGMALAPPEQIDCPRCGHVCSQRPWQGLTDEDWEHIDNKKGTALNTFVQGAVWAEVQLRERNT